MQADVTGVGGCRQLQLWTIQFQCFAGTANSGTGLQGYLWPLQIGIGVCTDFGD